MLANRGPVCSTPLPTSREEVEHKESLLATYARNTDNTKFISYSHISYTYITAIPE